MVCVCSPGVFYRVGPSGMDTHVVMSEATTAGWTYSPSRGWRCPECGRRDVNNQLDMCLAKVLPSDEADKNREQKQ